MIQERHLLAMTNALILIIEDEPEIADILRRCFEREGVRTVSAGEERQVYRIICD